MIFPGQTNPVRSGSEYDHSYYSSYNASGYMKKIVLIIPYYGKWPVWFPAFLESCKWNKEVNWLFVTDIREPEGHPENVSFLKMTFEEASSFINEKVGMHVNLKNPRKFCDLKPAYGHIFEDYIGAYDYWGFCDIDIIWGNIRSFLEAIHYEDFDIVTSIKKTIAGHFTILRNEPELTLLYRTDDQYIPIYKEERYGWFDENTFAKIVEQKSHNNEIKVYWDQFLLNVERGRDSHQDYHLDRWKFNKGNVTDLKANDGSGKDIMYLHFINWKRKMRSCELTTGNSSHVFYISYHSIHLRPHHKVSLIASKLRNFIWGYYRKEKFRIQKNRLKKRIRNRVQMMLNNGK